MPRQRIDKFSYSHQRMVSVRRFVSHFALTLIIVVASAVLGSIIARGSADPTNLFQFSIYTFMGFLTGVLLSSFFGTWIVALHLRTNGSVGGAALGAFVGWIVPLILSDLILIHHNVQVAVLLLLPTLLALLGYYRLSWGRKPTQQHNDSNTEQEE